MKISISLFYFAYFGALGAFLPFFSLYLTEAHLPPSEITQIYALLPVLGMVAPPLFGAAADARRARVWLLRGTSFASLLAFAGLLATRAHAAIYALVFLFAFFRAPITALADAATHEAVRVEGGSYGRLRLWGSVGFLVAALGAGLLGTRQVLWSTTAGLALAAAAAWTVPAPPPSPPRAPLGDAWLRLVGRGEMWLLLGAIALAQLAGSTYDSCFSLHLFRLGLPPRFIGLAWATGVLAEVALLAVSGRLIARVGADRLLVFALATAAIRWLLLGWIRSPAAILALQPLHGVTFGFFYVASTTLVRDRAEPDTANAAQGLFAASVSLGSVAGFLVAGRVLERFGSTPLWNGSAACALGAAGLALAYAARLR